MRLVLLLLSLGWLTLTSAAHLPYHRHKTTEYNALKPRDTTYRNVAYFTYWGSLTPAELPWTSLTHVLYAFLDVDPETGTIKTTYTDTTFLTQLVTLGKTYNVKILLSVAGWTFTSDLSAGVNTTAKQETFGQSAAALAQNLNIDGFDIDWEFPASTDQHNMVAAVKQLRTSLDNYKSNLEISIIVPSRQTNYQYINVKKMDQYVDFWNLIAYDYSGSWSDYTAHDANIYASTTKPESTTTTADSAVTHFLGLQVFNSNQELVDFTPSKLVLGISLSGRSFKGTTNEIGNTYSDGVGNGSPGESAGYWDYKYLPPTNAQVITTDLPSSGVAIAQATGSPIGVFCFVESNSTLISYDNKESVEWKAKYIKYKGLGGAMWWEANMDKITATDTSESLIVAGYNALNGASST
ncbi:chitinase [Penicillium macrosclerotiorum]|uniref:chitinase n=1 Tax=Penicillium macrosclerotiorum TaxID=303699 RepID=UPI002548A915|nr:chitinase [Penicillium macrosclerotiorum]KAJ5679859.1 chitinase [Penicillium macrosclerotiorum]